ncbi:hypothetical protein BD769DRAFT_1509206, partial [Suillus cothurnatus]
METNCTLMMNRAIYRRYWMYWRCRRCGMNMFIRIMRYAWRLHLSCQELCLHLLSYLLSLLLPTKIALTESIVSSCIHLLIQASIIINRRRTMSMQH